MVTSMSLAWFAQKNNKGRTGIENIDEQEDQLFAPKNEGEDDNESDPPTELPSTDE